MNRRKIIFLVSVVLLIGVFVLAAVAITSTTESTKTKADITRGDTKGNASSLSSEKEDAKELLDETLSREDIKKNVGEWEKFEMNSNGCERGVYAGKFYYKKFTIYSRTYDKGETFRIISVN